MKTMAERVPAEVFPPGEFLRDELDARGWTQTEFAEILGRPVRLVNEILVGKRGITPQTAQEIGAALGTSPELWLNLETGYRLSRAAPVPERIGREARLRERFPVREMIRRRWIEGSGDVRVLETQVKRFFGVETLDAPLSPPAAGRGVQGPTVLNRAEEAWLFRVEQVAAALQVDAAYSEQGLRDSLPRLQELLADPEYVRQVPAELAKCGVRFVVVEPLPDCRVDGVCFWREKPVSPVIGMSLRFDRIDYFWFVLRHEIEHVLRGEVSVDADLDPDAAPSAAGTPTQERAANEAAADFCLPGDHLDHFTAHVHPVDSEQRMVAFARSVGVHPGIVVGEMQKRTGGHQRLRRHLVKVRDILTESATTDGYGHFRPPTL
ncbi:MAG TPA: transcriptional regulator [Longimicrobium sp.]|jgi:HTH-type transcriptional regulator/antitoxin HigA|nr:transcriptional regulator [Longimicrobium sp.]